MKKVLCVLLVIILSLNLISILSAEETASKELLIDFEGFSDDELLTIFDLVNDELTKRNLDGSIEILSGHYIGGVDIPVGSYVLNATLSDNNSGKLYIKNYNENGQYGKDGGSPYDIVQEYYLGSGRDIRNTKIDIKEGEELEINFKGWIRVYKGLIFE